ncbi:MAG TPA: efflux RND transporter periplasmic adaptor subunit [Candidatus Omnitrophota bacterium]|nr:efflux RND transporter periplasmic adaptor subunit [Candidatus Omnitrophota bacterium]HPS36716.1 efflux RND transporter periplasmic adaptor subunit [Candidatus Omnitrophota bacterium]
MNDMKNGGQPGNAGQKLNIKHPSGGPVRMPSLPGGDWFSRNKKRVVIIGVVLGLIAAFFVAQTVAKHFKKGKPSLADTMKQQQQAAKDAPVAVKGFKVGRFNYEDSLNVLGTIKGALELKLSFEIPGMISSINYKAGEKYEEGALLVSLRQDDILLRIKRAQAAFNKAEAQAKVAENEVAENEKLLKMGAIPESTLEKKKLEMDAAKYEAEAQRLEMKANEAMLEKSNLYAPSLGMLGEVNVEEGETISQSTLIGTHINVEFVYAEFGIVERDVQKISLGQKAKVFVDAYPDKTFDGVIENIAPQITGTSRTSTAKVRVENPEGLLMPGMFARVRVLLYSKKDALVVPTDAIQGGEGEKFVYVIKPIEAAKAEVAPVPGGIQGGLPMLASAALAPKKPEKASKPGKVEMTGKTGKDGKPGDEKQPKKIEESTVEKRPVTIGYTRTDYSQIDAGLSEGELVVMTGFERLEDGKKIRLIETQEAEL